MNRPYSHARIAVRRAFSLIEMLVVLSVLSVLLTLLASSLWAVQRIYSASGKTMTDLQAEAALADRFREDVADARDTPEFARDFRASPVCLILQKAGDAFVMYRLANNAVERVVIGPEESESQSFPVRQSERIEFERQGKLLTLVVEGSKRSRLVVSSAVGGNNR